MSAPDTTSQKVLGGLFNLNRGVHKTALKRRFKTSNIAVLIKILFEFTRSFELQNVVRKSNSFQYKLEKGLYLWGLITGRIFLFTDR